MKIVNLSKTYKSDRKKVVHALKNVSFDLPQSGMVFILGQSGSGKTTLLNILGGLDSADSGSIEAAGGQLTNFTPAQLNEYRNNYCGFVFQEYNLIPELTVGQNVALALELQGERETAGRTEQVLSTVGLSGYAERKVSSLSGGQRQRVAIARAIIKEPKIILADEPTGALDGQTAAEILTLLKDLSRERLVVVVSHNRAFAEQFGDRVIRLSDGEIVSDSAPISEGNKQIIPVAGRTHGIPVTVAMGIGSKNLLKYPVRLCVAVFFSIISLLFLALSTCIASFNRVTAFVNGLYDNGAEVVAIYNNHKVYGLQDIGIFGTILGGDSGIVEKINFTTARLDDIEEILGQPVALAFSKSIHDFQYYINDLDYVSSILTDYDDHVVVNLGGYIELSQEMLDYLGYDLVGSLPASEDEVAIPECVLNVYILGGMIDDGVLYNITCAEDIIGRKLVLDRNDGSGKIITGVVDTHCDRGCNRGLYFSESSREQSEYFHEKLIVCSGYLSDYDEAYCLINVPDDRSRMTTLADYVFDSEDEEQYLTMSAAELSDFYTEYEVIGALKNAGYYLCAIFFIFALLMLCNFTSAAVRGQLRQVGILRAMGARFTDILKIYVLSDIPIGIAVFILSCALLPLALWLFNGFIASYCAISICTISLHFAAVAVVFVTAIGAVILGSLMVLVRYAWDTPAKIIRKGHIR